MVDPCTRCGLFHPPSAPCVSLDLALGKPDDGLQPGFMLAGRYEIVRVLHRGGMSAVYLAIDDKINASRVAIKELRLPDGAPQEDVREAETWFARESALLSTLQHPLIPEFYSVFRENGRSYIVQEFVPGENLEDHVRRQGTIESSVVLGWGIALCQLLEYLHALPEPVVFRDLKPANVLVRADWRAADYPLAVVDFGIARHFQPNAVGTVIGTPGYAPPEQYQGLSTPQSDIYALGATLHRLLTGYDPEQGSPFTFPSARTLNPAVPKALAAVIARATAINPADRYATAGEMCEALREVEEITHGLVIDRGARGAAFSRAWITAGVAALAITLMFHMVSPSITSTSYHPNQTGDSVSWRAPGMSADSGNAALHPTSASCPGLAPVDPPASGTIATCGPDGTAWRLHVQEGDLEQIDPNSRYEAYVLPYATQRVTAIIAVSDRTCNSDDIWLIGDTPQVIVLHCDSQQAYRLAGVPLNFRAEPGDGDLHFQLAGSPEIHTLSPDGLIRGPDGAQSHAAPVMPQF